MRAMARLHVVKKTGPGEEEGGGAEKEVVVVVTTDLGGGVCGPYPQPADVVPLIALRDDPQCTLLQETARQVFTDGPVDRLAEWGNHLLCAVPGTARVDVGQLETLHLSNQRGVCGKTFKKGDLCWNCRTCQTDPTCVQCDACFQRSDHRGHDVFFHHASPGGCCDCGDLEAWKQEGCCPAHRGGADVGQDPTDNLPPSMVAPARAVFREAVRLVTDACCHAVQGFNRPEHHPFLEQQAGPENSSGGGGGGGGGPVGQCVVRLHNDDVHTFQHVTNALLGLQLSASSAKTLTERVDADGHALVRRGPPEELRPALGSLMEEGLLVSMVDELQVEREERAIRLLRWLTQLSTRVDGLARLVAEVVAEAHPLSLAQHGFDKGTRWYTPLLRVHQPAPDDTGLLLSSDDAALRLSDARLSSRLALLMVADFFLAKRLRTELHGLYLHLLVDAHFKPALAKALTWVYPVVNGLYARGIGTHEDCLFSFSVQLYTTPSIVRWLATTTADEERLGLGTPGLLTVLTEAMLQAMRVAGWRDGQPIPERFWEHHWVQHRRFSHLLRDLDYALQTAGTATAMLEQADPGPGPRPLAAWMTLLGALQHACQSVRKTGAHVEFESVTWTASFSLTLPLYSTCAALVHNGLKPLDDSSSASSASAASSSSALAQQGGNDGEERAARLRAYTSLVQAAAGGILAWLKRRGVAHNLYRGLPPLSYVETGSGVVTSRPWVAFRLHAEPVSFHLPLHRFLAMAVLEGAAQGLGLPALELQDTEAFAALLAEFPLRCLAVTAQVTAGLWRRNGLSVQGQALHYASVPFCKVFRDLDLAALQLSALVGGNELLLGALLNRFNLVRWVCEPDYIPCGPSPTEPSAPPFGPGDVVVLAEEALLTLIHLVTELPAPPGPAHRDAALRRELVHRLACKEGLTHSEAQQATALVADGEAAEGAASAFDAVLAGVATKRAGGEEAAARFDLKPECAREYDPAFLHLTRQEHEAAVERVLNIRKALRRKRQEQQQQQQQGTAAAETPQPALGPPPLAHEDFAPVRLLLFWPEVLAFQHTVLQAAAAPPESAPARSKRSALLLVRCLHLLTLQLHCYQAALRLEEDACRVEPPALRAYSKRGEHRPVRDFFAALARPRRVNVQQRRGEEAAAADEAAEEQQEGPSMLRLLVQLARDSQGLNVGALFEEGLRWALAELSDKHLGAFSSEAEALLQGFGAGGDEEARGGLGGGGGKGRKAKKSEQAKRAQAKALSFLKQQQSNFWEEQMAAAEAEEEGAEEGGGAAAGGGKEPSAATVAATAEEKEGDSDKARLEAGAPVCLYCHERTGAAMGYIGFVQRSTALAHAVADTAEHRHGGVGRRYRVSHRECLVRAGPELDSAELTRLPRGTGLVVEEKRGRRLRVTAPVAGWVSEFTADQNRLVEPMRWYCFQQWGRTRLVVSLCGHAVHVGCWDAYYSSVLQELISEDRFDGRHALDVHRSEFLCPLCKTLSNILVPHVPPRLRPTPALALEPASSSSPMASLVPWALAQGEGADSGEASLRGWLRSLASEHASLRLPAELQRNVWRFASSLGEVLDVPWARVGLEDEEGGRGSLGGGPKKVVKALHVGWSAAAYTLLLEVVNGNASLREGRGEAVAAGGAEQQEREKHRRLLLAAVGILPAMAVDSLFLDTAVLRPLGRLLAGAPLVLPATTVAASQHNPRDEALHALPLALVPEHEVAGERGAAGGLPLERMRALHRDRRVHGKAGIVEAHPFFERPLLAHDLSTLAVGALVLVRQQAGSPSFLRLARLLALARLGQSLLEPWAPAAAEGGGEDVSCSFQAVAHTWARWRRTMREQAVEGEGGGGEQVRAVAPGLERGVFSRWRPFLQLLVGLLEALDASPPGDEALGPGASVPQLLGRLGLRVEDTAAPEVGTLMAAWLEQYRSFSRQIPYLWPEDDAKAAAVQQQQQAAAQQVASAAVAAATIADVSVTIPAPVPAPMMEEEEESSHNEASEGMDEDGGDSSDSEDEGEDEDAMAMEEVEDGFEPGPVGDDVSSSGLDVSSSLVPPPGPPLPYAYHCAPYLSLLDGAATAADAQGARIPTPTDSAGLALPLYDLSHLGVSDEVALRLVPLPQHYTDLYALQKDQYWALSTSGPGAAGPGGTAAGGGSSGGGGGALARGLEDPAICLACGAVLAAGPRMQGRTRLSTGPGVCTLHARGCGSGAGVMLLVNKGCTLLFRESRAIFHTSVYVDQYGEEDPNLRRGRPLSLSQARYDRLTQLYRQHGAAKEVTSQRLNSDRVVRSDYY